MERSDFLTPFRRASLCLAWRYHDVRLSFAPAGPARVTGRPGVHKPVSARPCIVESAGRPKFLGDSDVPMPSSPTPAGPDTPCLSGAPVLPPRRPRRRLQQVVISGLNRPALALAVYASPGGSPQPDARLASGCWLGFAGWDWLPTESLRKVLKCLLTSSPPFPSFAWRKDGLQNIHVCRQSLRMKWSVPGCSQVTRLTRSPPWQGRRLATAGTKRQGFHTQLQVHPFDEFELAQDDGLFERRMGSPWGVALAAMTGPESVPYERLSAPVTVFPS
jgi:hypothetical protein